MNNKYSRVFNHGDGLLVLNELIAVFQSKALFDASNTNQTMFNLGQDDVIKYILARVDSPLTDKELEQ